METITDIQTQISRTNKMLSFNVAVFIFFLWFFPSLTRYWALFLLVTIFVYMVLKKNINLRINHTSVLSMGFIFINIFGIIQNNDNTFDALQFVFSFSLYFLCYLLLISIDDWTSNFIKILTVICFFFIGGSLIQLINPELVMEFNRLHLSDVLFSQSYVFYRNGALNGFTYQTAVNGYIISIFMSIVFSYMFTQKSKREKMILGLLYMFLFYLLFLTQKRGFIVFNLLIAIFLFFKLSKYKIKTFIPFIIFMGVFILILINTEAGSELILRTFEQEDITTGRGTEAMTMWEDFLKNPILGNGTYSTMNEINIFNGHNIYLQVLRENGIFGFLVFLLILISNLWQTNGLIKTLKNYEEPKFYLSISIYIQLLFVLWGFTGNPLYDNFPLILYFVSIAMSEVYKRNKVKYKKTGL